MAAKIKEFVAAVLKSLLLKLRLFVDQGDLTKDTGLVFGNIQQAYWFRFARTQNFTRFLSSRYTHVETAVNRKSILTDIDSYLLLW